MLLLGTEKALKASLCQELGSTSSAVYKGMDTLPTKGKYENSYEKIMGMAHEILSH